MPYQKIISPLPGGGVMAECGPMRLVISGSVGEVPQQETAVRAAQESFEYLERIARLRDVLGQRHHDISGELEDLLAVNMVESVSAVGDRDLTPMAAVAGVIADAVADFLVDRGMTKVVVDNGGDVAVRLQPAGEKMERSVTVGIRSEISQRAPSHVISLNSGLPSWGVASSGLGGRSLTRGVASVVTAIARRAALADAAATAIANASFVEDAQVIQVMADEIDPDTDIPGLPVTVRVGRLSEDKKSEALTSALNRAETLVRKNVIFGAFVAVQGEYAMTRFFEECLVRSPV
ncbi:MAG: hypothetical protein KJ823_01905 [Proteobacteria bacterium]|nr:hypothetical protein [Pseudomonadota bacterium]